ncbi:MAG: tetratricopeptide repeat protein [Chlorobiales bacterium]|nr:tetratricopeptide repeat protein [Chlorobiales bacterium]
MIRLLALLLFITLASSSMQEMLQDYRLQLKADALYKKSSYSTAESTLRQLLATLPEGEKKTSATFNLACTLYMQGKYAEALSIFARKPKTVDQKHDIELQARFNEGNSFAMIALGTNGNNRKKELFLNSLNCFKYVLLNNPNDGDAKINYEIIQRYLHELEKPQHSSSSSSEKKSNTQQTSGISRDIAERLLEKAQQDESSLMRQLPGKKATTAQGSHNDRDW